MPLHFTLFASLFASMIALSTLIAGHCLTMILGRILLLTSW